MKIAMNENQVISEKVFLSALSGKMTQRIPFWFMRQAGRYLPEYRAIREKTGFLELCRTPSLCAEVMLVTVERLGVEGLVRAGFDFDLARRVVDAEGPEDLEELEEEAGRAG